MTIIKQLHDTMILTPNQSERLNYPPIITAIAASGYEGYLGHEFIPKGDPVAALEAAALEAAYRMGDV